MRILIVEDDKPLLEGIAALLMEENYQVDFSLSGDEGYFMASHAIYDAIVLDIMLPEMNGVEIVKELRNNQVNTPVLFLTAKDSIDDRVKGLDAGANDYLIKPFAAPELLARLRVLLRQNEQQDKGFLSYGPIRLKEDGTEAFAGEQPLNLTVKEMQLLEYFLRNKEQILIRDQIFNRVWGFSSEAGVGVVDVYVHHLRKKLAKCQCDQYLKTIRGVGFMLKGDTENV